MFLKHNPVSCSLVEPAVVEEMDGDAAYFAKAKDGAAYFVVTTFEFA